MKNRILDALWFSLLIGLAGQILASSQTVSIAGIVMDDDRRPVSGASVFLERIRRSTSNDRGQPKPLESPFSSSVLTGPDGKFVASNLLPGQYTVCAVGTSREHLGTCEIDQPSQRVIANGSGPMNIALTLVKGSLLNIHIHDSASRLSTGSTPTVGVVSAKGAYKRATLVALTANKADYVIAVPAADTVRLLLSSPFPVDDNGGTHVILGKPSLSIEVGRRSQIEVNLVMH